MFSIILIHPETGDDFCRYQELQKIYPVDTENRVFKGIRQNGLDVTIMVPPHVVIIIEQHPDTPDPSTPTDS